MAEGLLRSLAGNRFQVEERIIGVREITALDQKVRRLLLSGGEEIQSQAARRKALLLIRSEQAHHRGCVADLPVPLPVSDDIF